MKFATFKKGTHPPHRKGTSCREIEFLPPSGELVFPVIQHIGAPCVPLVKAGERVLLGQRIADTEAFVSAPIVSSVSGTVRVVEPRPQISGELVLSVVIESDGSDEPIPSMVSRENYLSLDPGEVRRIVREAGIVGMGGACFPTAVKLSPPPGTEIRHIIVNGAECEPYLTCDDRLMVEQGEEVLEGLRIVLGLFPDARGHIAIEDNKPEAIGALKISAEKLERIDVIPVRTKYPQGAEKMLIYALTGREVPSGKLPADVGCIMLNVRTTQQIFAAVALGHPVVDRIVTVTGDALAEPNNLRVRLGTSIRALVEAAGGFVESPAKIIAGGPLMGTALSSLDVPVVKGTSGLLALTERSAGVPPESSCIRCAKCVSVCPMNLMPYQLNALVLKRDYEGFEAEHGMNCIECGCCAYTCPSKRHLVQSMRDGKRTVAARRRNRPAPPAGEAKK
jgi:electron transport complex protein RnfC